MSKTIETKDKLVTAESLKWVHDKLDMKIDGGLFQEFDETATYAVGDYVIYNGYLYKMTYSHTGAWDASDAEQVDFMESLEDLGDRELSFTDPNNDGNIVIVGNNTAVVDDAIYAEIEDVKEDLIPINSAVFDATVYNWTSIGSSSYPYGFRTGIYDSQTGEATSTSHYLRSANKANFDGYNKVEVKAPNGMSFGIYEYDSSGNFVKIVCPAGVYTSPSSGTQYFEFVPVKSHRYNFVLSGWDSIINSDITQALVNGWVVTLYTDTISKKQDKLRENYILYESGSYANGKATERISIFIPATIGYLKYTIYHFVDTENNSNCWQLYHIYHVDDSFGNQIDLSRTGEYECAIRLDNRDDFSGGHTHGDEQIDSIIFLVDGVPTPTSELTSTTAFNELKIIETSVLYDPADSTTEIADHGREYIFSKSGLILHQSLTWKVSASLANCFLAMFLPSKGITDRACANSDFETLILASSVSEPLTTIVKQGATSVFMWDTEEGFSGQISVPVYPTGLTGGDLMTISDNDGNGYNKVYFKVCGGGSSTVGELWKSTTVYSLDYAKPQT